MESRKEQSGNQIATKTFMKDLPPPSEHRTAGRCATVLKKISKLDVSSRLKRAKVITSR